MGGDFIMDKDGVMQFIYCSKTASDRPSVDDLVKELQVSTELFTWKSTNLKLCRLRNSTVCVLFYRD